MWTDLVVLVFITSSVLCKEKANTILISDAENGRQFVLSENSKEKKIVIRNNYRPCEKTDRVMTDQAKDESKTPNRQSDLSNEVPDLILDRTILDRAMMDKMPGQMTDKASILLDKVSSRPPVQSVAEKSLLSEMAAISAERQQMIPIKLTNTISDRTSSAGQNGKGKKNKNKNKTKESKEKEKQKSMMQQSAPAMPATYSNLAIPIEPILKSSLAASVHNQLSSYSYPGPSYPVYIPENPLADYMKQRLIEHPPIIYQIEESHDYPLFLSQFHHLQPGSALQLKSPGLGYAGHLTAGGMMPDYAYINHYHNHLQQQYQQAQLLNSLIPHILQSTINKKPINILAGPSLNYPLLGLPTLKYVNFQSPSSTENAVDNNLINKLNLLTKSIVYSNNPSHLFNTTPGKAPKSNKNKMSDPKKDFKEFKTDGFDSAAFSKDFANDFTKDFRDKEPFSKDYQTGASFGKDPFSSKDPFFSKDSYSTSYSKDYNKDYLSNFGKDYSPGYQSYGTTSGYKQDANQQQKGYSNENYSSDSFSSSGQQAGNYPNDYTTNYLAKANRSEPYFRLPLFRKADDRSEEQSKTTVQYPLFSPKDEAFSTAFNEQPSISKKEDTGDSFKPIIVYSKLMNERAAGSPFVKRNASAAFLNQLGNQLVRLGNRADSTEPLDSRPQFDLNKIELERFSAENKLEETDRKFDIDKTFDFGKKLDPFDLKSRIDHQFNQKNAIQNTASNPLDSTMQGQFSGSGEIRDLDSSEMINNSTLTSKKTGNSTIDNSVEFDYNR